MCGIKFQIRQGQESCRVLDLLHVFQFVPYASSRLDDVRQPTAQKAISNCQTLKEAQTKCTDVAHVTSGQKSQLFLSSPFVLLLMKTEVLQVTLDFVVDHSPSNSKLIRICATSIH